VVVDEVATVAVLLLVVVGLADGLVAEESVLSELEDEAETRAVEVLHADVGQVLENLLIAVGDGLGERRVLHGAEPELRDTLDIGGSGLLLLIGLGLLGLIIALIVLALGLTSLDLLLGRLSKTVDDLGALLVQGSELGEELLLELENLLLELSLKLGVLLLHALEAVNASADGSGQRLDVAGGLANKTRELVLHHRNEARVLCEEGSGGGAVEVLCSKAVSWTVLPATMALLHVEYDEPSLMSDTLGAWARLEMGAF
jgi:hypothetical protein